MPAFANAYLIPELIMNPVPEPGEPPKTKVMVHGLPGSKFTRQHAPTDAAFEHIKDGIRNLAQINSPLSFLWVSVLEAAAQSAPTAPPSDRSDREAHSSHHHTSCILRQVLSLSLPGIDPRRSQLPDVVATSCIQPPAGWISGA
jgi:hypothetical protein